MQYGGTPIAGFWMVSFLEDPMKTDDLRVNWFHSSRNETCGAFQGPDVMYEKIAADTMMEKDPVAAGSAPNFLVGLHSWLYDSIELYEVNDL